MDRPGLLLRFGSFCYARAVGGAVRSPGGALAVPFAEVLMAAMANRRPRWRVLLAAAAVAVAAVAAAGAVAVHASAPAAHAVADGGVINAD